MPSPLQRIARREGEMVSNGTRFCAALALAAMIAAPAQARRPARSVRVAPPALPVPLAQSSFVLRDDGVSPAAALQASSRALVRDRAARRAGDKGAEFTNVTVGPSWSYQSDRTGALIEMGALGGGVVADRPKLAHVALAWQF